MKAGVLNLFCIKLVCGMKLGHSSVTTGWGEGGCTQKIRALYRKISAGLHWSQMIIQTLTAYHYCRGLVFLFSFLKPVYHSYLLYSLLNMQSPVLTLTQLTITFSLWTNYVAVNYDLGAHGVHYFSFTLQNHHLGPASLTPHQSPHPLPFPCYCF